MGSTSCTGSSTSAAAHLQPHGILIVEVGNSEDALVEARPKLPFTWLDSSAAAAGVFLLTRERLVAKSQKSVTGQQGAARLSPRSVGRIIAWLIF